MMGKGFLIGRRRADEDVLSDLASEDIEVNAQVFRIEANPLDNDVEAVAVDKPGKLGAVPGIADKGRNTAALKGCVIAPIEMKDLVAPFQRIPGTIRADVSRSTYK